jgi:deglycase
MGKKILMLVGDFVEDYEVMVPFQALGKRGRASRPPCTTLKETRHALRSGTGPTAAGWPPDR